MKIDPADLDKPAFGASAATVNADVAPTEEAPALGSHPEEGTDTVAVPAPAPADIGAVASDEDAEGQAVPYTRFQTIHRRAREAEREADEWRRRAEEYEHLATARRTVETPAPTDLPPEWVALHGDSPQSKAVYEAIKREEDRRFNELTERLENERISEARAERAAVAENMDELDAGLEDAAAYFGRDLTDDEQLSLLDIQDEFTPQDEEGNFLGPLLPIEKAVEVYRARQAATQAPRQRARTNVAALSGAGTSSETVGGDEKAAADKNWNPLDWNSYKKRLQGL